MKFAIKTILWTGLFEYMDLNEASPLEFLDDILYIYIIVMLTGGALVSIMLDHMKAKKWL